MIATSPSGPYTAERFAIDRNSCRRASVLVGRSAQVMGSSRRTLQPSTTWLTRGFRGGADKAIQSHAIARIQPPITSVGQCAPR